MLLFYVRHGDPIYSPDSLTPLGKRQAEAVAKRLALFGVDKIYCSTSQRAKETAQPTCEITKNEMELLDFCNEIHPWEMLNVKYDDDKRTWMFYHKEYKKLFHSPEIRKMGDKWYDHPAFAEYDYKKGIDFIADNTDAFLLSLGYRHIDRSGMYEVVKPNKDRVALFAHQGFGIAFLSHILGIPYPMFCTNFDMTHSGLTVINFEEFDGMAIPKMLTLSDTGHLYREGLPMKYNYGDSF